MAKREARPRKSRWALSSQPLEPQRASGSSIPSDVMPRDRHMAIDDVRMMVDATDAANKGLDGATRVPTTAHAITIALGSHYALAQPCERGNLFSSHIHVYAGTDEGELPVDSSLGLSMPPSP